MTVKHYKTTPEQRARARRYYEANRERILAESQKERDKRTPAEHRQALEYQKEWRAEHKDSVRESNAKFRRENFDLLHSIKMRWIHANPEKHRDHSRRSYRKKKAAELAERKLLLDADAYRPEEQDMSKMIPDVRIRVTDDKVFLMASEIRQMMVAEAKKEKQLSLMAVTVKVLRKHLLGWEKKPGPKKKTASES